LFKIYVTKDIGITLKKKITKFCKEINLNADMLG